MFRPAGWTQAEMADIMGLDRSCMGEIEQGKRNPCLLNLEVIASSLKISLPQLFSNIK
jgi:DNA-binding XRE family transcriptional regulator